jgi:EAL domain-containing protein (putative c-di-GMP-specific phosphodiesterase class I)/CheY-like chemotaxis protein
MIDLKKFKILYVEDDVNTSEEVEYFLGQFTDNLYVAFNGKEGLEMFQEHRPDVVITDIQMPLMNGIDMIAEIRKHDREVPIIITTAFNETQYLLKAINLQVEGYIIKPLNFKELAAKLHKITEPIALKRELIAKNKELEYLNANLDAIVKEKTKELEYFYNHDPLTGLSNFLQLGEEIRVGSYKNLILLDIANFSIINKQYGKSFANGVLKAVADSLEKHLTSKMRLFKTESDTFVFLTKEEQESELGLLCQQIISFFDTQTILYENIELNINFSIGIAPIVDDFYPMINAQYALEIGKDIGSRYYYFYDETQESLQKAKEAIKWLQVTKKLIEEDEIEPYFQPIIDVKTQKIVKFEVLARGNYDGEILSPLKFIEPAERLGLIGSLTRMMINKSFTYFEGTDYSFSINLTQRDLLDNYIIAFLEQKLLTYNIKASNVTFEILETVTLGDYHSLILLQLQKLKAMGFEIAIDDFGVENSNFARLLEIDFDYLKLDGLFIRKLVENKKDRIILSAIVSLSKSLKVKTIAEFIENEALYEVVKSCGIDFVQGYYIGEPLNAKDLYTYMKTMKKK